jgi:ribonucleoside-diphosphate reductase alpha chain
MSSCFLLAMQDDSIDGIGYVETNGKNLAQQGGVGLSIHNVRATGSYIREQMEPQTGLFLC